MKKNLLLIVVFFVSTLSSAQPFRKDDTVVVFRIAYENPKGGLPQYLPYKVKKVIHWTDKQNIMHKSVVRKISSNYLLLDTTVVYPSDITGVSLSQPMGFIPSQSQRPSSVVSDSSGLFIVMTYYDYEILTKSIAVSAAQHHNDPFFRNVNPEKYTADLEKQRQHRLEMFAALDTCPLHYGIKTNIVLDLTNEINLSVELPIKRNFCIDVGVGILYTKPDASEYDYASFMSQISRFRNRQIPFFERSYLTRKGFSLEVIPKFFLSKKKHLYIGPMLNFHYFYYKEKWVWLNADGSDYYHRTMMGFQSEKSASVQLNAILGVQTPQIKRFVFDAFIYVGLMYRGGVATRSINRTYSSGGSPIEYFDPPLKLHGGCFSPTAMLGFRMGWRFGKAKLYK